jgi:hypothetical protein
VKRLLGAGAGLIFKGSGFYITDYRSEGYKSAAKSDSKPATPPPAGASSSDSPSEKGDGGKNGTVASKPGKTPPKGA